MTTLRRALHAIALAATLVSMGLTVSACSKDEGPVQKAGEKLDDAKDAVSDAVDPKGPAEKAGRAVDRALDD